MNVNDRWQPPPLVEPLLSGGSLCGDCEGRRVCRTCHGTGFDGDVPCEPCYGGLWCWRCRGTGEIGADGQAASPFLYERRWRRPIIGLCFVGVAVIFYTMLLELEERGGTMRVHALLAALYNILGRVGACVVIALGGVFFGLTRMERFSEPIRRRHDENRERELLSREIEQRPRAARIESAR